MSGKVFFQISVVALVTAGAIAQAAALSFKDISGNGAARTATIIFVPTC
jgi:hypothetical protein